MTRLSGLLPPPDPYPESPNPRSAAAMHSNPCSSEAATRPASDGAGRGGRTAAPRQRVSGPDEGLPEATVDGCRSTDAPCYGWPRGYQQRGQRGIRAAAGVKIGQAEQGPVQSRSYGSGVGYDLTTCLKVSRTRGLTQDWPVVIVGAGNLGRARAQNYGGFLLPRIHIAAMRDSDTAMWAAGCQPDRPARRRARGRGGRNHVAIGVIATPADPSRPSAPVSLGGSTRILNCSSC